MYSVSYGTITTNPYKAPLAKPSPDTLPQMPAPAAIPHTKPPDHVPIAPDRFAESIHSFHATAPIPTTASIALLGLPDELGVRLNKGRPGAAQGPSAFRRALAAYGCPFDANTSKPLPPIVIDCGDIIPADGDTPDALLETHNRITEAARAIFDAGLTLFAIGGGHDLTFPAIRALSQSLATPLSGINVDPHLDVRTNPCSGMPFRSLIEGGFLDPARFTEYAIGRFTNTQQHIKYLTEKGASLITIDRALNSDPTPTALITESKPNFISLDMDVLSASSAPGVSSLCPLGLNPAHLVECAAAAGAHPNCRHIDIMELSPPNDAPAEPTVRIAALIFLTFVAARAEATR